MIDLEKRIVAIETRNEKVEQDKAWEISLTRRTSIAILTYFVVVLYLIAINNDKPFINSAVPVVGFLLSTIALSWIKNIWQKK
ncbi:MAG TPA: hypothetical protein VJJ78_03585 [Candidatus Saccharimonadales bacterium]|nr:hypothetical protein [Candidatus Saccharimonadales bacterium]